MKTVFLVAVLVLTLACPAASHGFALLRWTCDAIANQLGLDRGPIPKVISRLPVPLAPDLPGGPSLNHPDTYRLYIPANGW
jgi:hypothetical protein